jgi:O-antigen/teichoic acid export membrane protein
MTLYVVPYELVARLRIVPASLVNALFPSLSEHNGVESKQSLNRLYGESLKYLLLILLPSFLVLAFLGTDIITAWVGPDYALLGGRVLQIMAGAALLNSLAYVPYTALVALGRPDLPAKFHLAELPLYLGLSLVLIPRWGIAGAAWAVAIRLAVDAIALFWAARRYLYQSFADAGVVRVVVVNMGLTISLAVIRGWPTSSIARLGAAVICLFAYLPAAWFFVLGERERPILIRMLQARERAA